MKLKSQAARIPKGNIEDDESVSWIRYPNLVYYQEKYCADCEKNCEIPSMDAFGCMIKKLSNKKKKRDVEK
jgi:hypothetical protein